MPSPKDTHIDMNQWRSEGTLRQRKILPPYSIQRR